MMMMMMMMVMMMVCCVGVVGNLLQLPSNCCTAGRGASEVSGRRLCQVPGVWARRSTVRSTGSSKPGTDRAQRRSGGWAAVDLGLSSCWGVSLLGLVFEGVDCVGAAVVNGGRPIGFL